MRTTTADAALLHRYLAAWEASDATALTELLRVDAKLAMPPLPTWLDGRDAIVAFLSRLMPSLGEVLARPIEIAGGPGIAVWTRAPGSDRFLATSVTALGVENGAIVSIDTFLVPSLFAYFGLPEAL